MEEFLREVQEDMEREKYRAFWQRYGRYGVALAAVIVASTIGIQIWKNIELAANHKSTDVLIVALEKNTPEAWAEAAKQLDGNAKAIALLNAGAAADAEKAAKDKALQSFARARAGSTATNTDEPFASPMLERQAVSSLEKGEVEAAKKPLATLSADDTIPMSARERAKAISRFTEQHADAFKK